MTPIIAPDYPIELPASDLTNKREIAKALASHLMARIPPPIGENKKDLNGVWTTSVRRELRSIVTTPEYSALDWKCFPNNPEKPESAAGEFLVDFVWQRAREGAVLVVESEWSSADHEILNDFDKIAVIKAPFKLMIYSPWTAKANSTFIKEKFEDYLSHYKQHLQGETYIFLEFMPGERAQAFIWQASQSGPSERVTLDSLIPVTKIERPAR